MQGDFVTAWMKWIMKILYAEKLHLLRLQCNQHMRILLKEGQYIEETQRCQMFFLLPTGWLMATRKQV